MNSKKQDILLNIIGNLPQQLYFNHSLIFSLTKNEFENDNLFIYFFFFLYYYSGVITTYIDPIKFFKYYRNTNYETLIINESILEGFFCLQIFL